MPERPKRRKNNKNKKNKNKVSQQVGNNQSSEINISDDVGIQNDTKGTPLTEVPSDIPSPVQCHEVSNTFPNEDPIVNYDSEIKLTSETICNVMQTLNEDLNNNNDQTIKLDIVTTKANNEDSETLPSTSKAVSTVTENIQDTLDSTMLAIDSTSLKIDDSNINTAEHVGYVVEAPDKPTNSRPKICNNIKSKSLDNDDEPKIVEITDSSLGPLEEHSGLSIIENSNVLVSDVDSDVEWENTDELKKSNNIMDINEIATGTLSVTTIPLNIAQCEHAKSLTLEEELSLRNYLQTLNLSTEPENIHSMEIKTEIEEIINREIKHRLRKKALAEDFLTLRHGPQRILDVIDEEGSSESSMTSRRQSYLSDKKSDNEDLEDDVFEDPSQSKDSKYNSKAIKVIQKRSLGRLLPQQCLLLGTKIKEPEVTEARGDWTVKTIEQMTGAELVYLTDSSSSTSSVHELFEESDGGIDTDVSVRMITPTIEVTDTESLLKNTFIANSNDNSIVDISQKKETDNKAEKVEHIVKVEYEGNFNKPNEEAQKTSHEIVVLSTDNIKTDLYVKELDGHQNQKNMLENKTTSNKDNTDDEYALEIKVLKCELNDAINHLIKEVSSDSEPNETNKDSFTRQDSSSSVCSSQCTAKYNPTSSSLNDVSNIMHDESENSMQNQEIISTNKTSHVHDVIEYVTGSSAQRKLNATISLKQPLTLRDSCVRKITKLPYGDKILEELASVSKRLQNITIHGIRQDSTTEQTSKKVNATEKMPYYPLPDLSGIHKINISSKPESKAPEVPPPPVPPPPIPPPPAIKPRHSSFKKSHDDDHWTALPTKTEPVYVCLSPSQKMLMEKTNTTITKEDASNLVDMHKKYVDRRGYNEYFNMKQKPFEKNADPTPVLPFKSQTGSRLLALIRDPNFTGKVRPSQNNNYSYSLDQLEKKYTHPENVFETKTDRSLMKDTSKTFKPIPPPRPKKISSSFYESDDGSEFTDSSLRSMKSERKYFHFSTGSLSKEIENDVSSIQNMHRFHTNVQNSKTMDNCPRRPSLPKDLCDQQMEYIRQKEKEVAAELQRLEENTKLLSQKRGPRAPLISESHESNEEHYKDKNNFFKSHRKQTIISSHPEKTSSSEKSKLSSLFSSSQEEILRDKMYSEYVTQMAEREERKQHKLIKLSTPNITNSKISKSMSALELLDSKVNNRIEKEFISKARERWYKLGIQDPETEDERESDKCIYKEPKVIEHKIKVIAGDEETDVQKLPSHLQEFVGFAAKEKEQGSSTGESKSGPASPHVVIMCAVIILVLAVGKYFLRLLRNK